MKGAVGEWGRAASSRLRVPLALTLKSVWGSLAAQSWEGWAAVWMTSSISPARSRKIRSIASPSRMSAFSRWNSGCWVTRRAVTWEVEDSGPKKLARMSFSTPTTSKPSAMKCSTASEPIRPPAPVMIATRIRARSPPPAGGAAGVGCRGDPRSIRGYPLVDVGKHLPDAAPGPPLVQAEDLRAVGKVYGHVAGPGLDDRRHRHLVAGQLAADRGRLPQREAALATAADVDGAPAPGLPVEQLALDQADQHLRRGEG